DQQVAHDTAGSSGSVGQHDYSKQIEAMPDARHGAAQREHEGTEEIEPQYERFHCALQPRDVFSAWPRSQRVDDRRFEPAVRPWDARCDQIDKLHLVILTACPPSV